jgi:hypothetical protein
MGRMVYVACVVCVWCMGSMVCVVYVVYGVRVVWCVWCMRCMCGVWCVRCTGSMVCMVYVCDVRLGAYVALMSLGALHICPLFKFVRRPRRVLLPILRYYLRYFIRTRFLKSLLLFAGPRIYGWYWGVYTCICFLEKLWLVHLCKLRGGGA